MRIISKYKDYYDYMEYLGIDEKVRFERHTVDYDVELIFNFPKRDHLHLEELMREGWNQRRPSLPWVIFCGKKYYIPVRRRYPNDRTYKSDMLDACTIQECIERWNGNRESWDRWEPFNVEMFEPQDLKWECNYPIVTNMMKCSERYTYNNKNPEPEWWQVRSTSLTVYPILAKIPTIQDRIPPQEAWQKLSMFLASQEPDMVDISNKDKILQGGFDLKSSFRKDKHQNKPRKKRKNR